MAKLEMNKNTTLEFGLYSLGDHLLNPFKGEKVSYEQRINEIIEASKLADEAGIDVFAVGESHQEHFTTQAHTVVLGAIAGLVLSIVLAITFVETLGNSGMLRESMEAGLGIVAVILMFIVGVCMHKRSNAKRWNDMIKNMYANAISNGNLVLLATLGLISVLREGVEVIIFYMGMIGELATKDFVIGIALAIVILIVFALLFRFIVRLIPIFYIFRVLSIFIFIMGFKMLGVSIQKLQLLGAMPRHVIEGFPTINWLGFYPSYEPLIAQAAYIMVVAILIFKFKK